MSKSRQSLFLLITTALKSVKVAKNSNAEVSQSAIFNPKWEVRCEGPIRLRRSSSGFRPDRLSRRSNDRKSNGIGNDGTCGIPARRSRHRRHVYDFDFARSCFYCIIIHIITSLIGVNTYMSPIWVNRPFRAAEVRARELPSSARDIRVSDRDRNEIAMKISRNFAQLNEIVI